MSIASTKLEIPPLLDADDLLDGKPDAFSLMTYLSFFKNAC
jgi:hypothetical protein